MSLGAAILTALALREMGVDEERICDLFDDDDWSVKLGYVFDTGEMSCEIEWERGDKCRVTGLPKSSADA